MRTRALGLALAFAIAGCSERSTDTEPAATAPAVEPAALPAADPAASDPVARVRAAVGAVDDARLRSAADDPANWLTYGGTYAEQRYSPLAEIDAGSIERLGLVWSFETDQIRGHEATPIVVDGVLFFTGPWSVVYAVDARTGKKLWIHDPKVPLPTATKACCDVVNRGVAVYQGKVFVGTLDGRLLALDAGDGTPVWEVQTVDPSRPYTVTGAPRVVKGMVLIGNGGAEFGVRGYVSAYDATTGALRWRTYTVPGDPSKPFESEALENAAATWTGDLWWKAGGGGTVWDSIVYDAELDKIYVGTGNGSPWSKHVRSPGGGDNLYLSSILALDPATGEMVWYFQETPGDTWDYTATQQITLADLTIDGQPRKVILHAPKNGFFYVIDRETGKLVSAEKYATVTWAEGLDPKTGRPIPAKGSDYRKEAFVTLPSTLGAHNWHPMSFNPKTGLVYIPAQEVPSMHGVDAGFVYRPGSWNTGTDFGLVTEFPRNLAKGSLLAWDPVAQKERWRVPYDFGWNGGTLTTGGNLVFQGRSDGRFAAYRADDGLPLWSAPAGTAIMAGPVTYQVDGRQYVSVLAGWGGIYGLYGGDAALATGSKGGGRLLTYALDGKAPPPPTSRGPLQTPGEAPPAPTDAAQRKEGESLYAWNCQVCHGSGAIGGGVLPDLRHVSAGTHEIFTSVVLGGRKDLGMPDFSGQLTEKQVEAIHAYVLSKVEAAATP